MLQVLRPGKALLDRFAGMLESRVYAWQILLLLPWCEADQRDRARRLVATFEAEHRVPTHARRIWIEQAKKGLARTEAETRAARRSLEVRESWLAVPR
jgi:hypothetical protein